ncbi:MAG: hypothetical protein K2O39_01125, partial [Clostridiales bacterium]|nr:hypothetical protein [Clostridiales bacterium]
GVKTVVDMALEDAEQAADLYTVIKDGVKLQNATMTLTLTVGDNKEIKGVKIDCYTAHTYSGEAAEGSLLADNDYRAVAEITIDEYTTPTEDFEITIDPNFGYRASVISLLYEVTDKDVSIYLETGAKPANVTIEQGLCVETLDGEVTRLDNVPADAFKFDAATSSFVIDGAIVKSALDNAEFGTTLFALVYFDGEQNDLYAIGVSYVNDDWQAIGEYAYKTVMGLIMGAGSDNPNIGEIASIDGMYYLTDDDELDEIYYLEIVNGQIVTFIEHGNNITENVMLMVNGNEVAIVITYPETEQEPAHGIVLYGNVYTDYINITAQIDVDENGDYTSAVECDLYLYKYGIAVDQ